MSRIILATMIIVGAPFSAQAGQVSVISPPAIVVVLPPVTPVVVTPPTPSTPVIVPAAPPNAATPATPSVVTPTAPGSSGTLARPQGVDGLRSGNARTSSAPSVSVSLPSLQSFNVASLSTPQMQAAASLIQGVLASPPAGLTPAQAATLRNQLAQMQAALGR